AGTRIRSQAACGPPSAASTTTHAPRGGAIAGGRSTSSSAAVAMRATTPGVPLIGASPIGGDGGAYGLGSPARPAGNATVWLLDGVCTFAQNTSDRPQRRTPGGSSIGSYGGRSRPGQCR